MHAALRPGGIFYISLKEKPEYMGEVKEDRFGTRLFYFYNVSLIRELAGKNYELAAHDRKTISETDWFEVALRKV